MPATAQFTFSICTVQDPTQGVVPPTVKVSSHLNLTQARPTSLQTCLEARLSRDSRHAKTTINYNHHMDLVSDPKDSMKLPFSSFHWIRLKVKEMDPCIIPLFICHAGEIQKGLTKGSAKARHQEWTWCSFWLNQSEPHPQIIQNQVVKINERLSLLKELTQNTALPCGELCAFRILKPLPCILYIYW